MEVYNIETDQSTPIFFCERDVGTHFLENIKILLNILINIPNIPTHLFSVLFF